MIAGYFNQDGVLRNSGIQLVFLFVQIRNLKLPKKLKRVLMLHRHLVSTIPLVLTGLIMPPILIRVYRAVFYIMHY